MKSRNGKKNSREEEGIDYLGEKVLQKYGANEEEGV